MILNRWKSGIRVLNFEHAVGLSLKGRSQGRIRRESLRIAEASTRCDGSVPAELRAIPTSQGYPLIKSEDENFGWQIGTLPAAMQSVVDWLDHGQSLLGARSVIAGCDMEVMEIVYVERRDDRLLVSDRGDTVRYFEAGDSVLKPLGVAEISTICERFGATLVAVADMWPHITVN